MLDTVMLVTAIGSAAASGAALLTAVAMPQSPREQLLRVLSTFGTQRPGSIAARPPSTGLRLFTTVLIGGTGRIGELLTSSMARRRLTRYLDYAGNPTGWPIERVIRMRGTSLFALALIGLLWGSAVKGTPGMVFGGVVGTALGFFLPDLMLQRMGTRRQQLLANALPDVLDALVIGVEAGLGLDAAMAQVAQNLQGPLPDEFHRILQEMKIGMARTDALRALTTRTTVRELKSLMTALIQSGELGVAVADVLREHAREQRVKRRQRAEELAQKIPVKLVFPVLLCLFPAIFVVILGPAILRMIAVFGS